MPLRNRSFYAALGGAVAAVGAILGPFLSGVIVTQSTWRWVFYLNLPAGGCESDFLSPCGFMPAPRLTFLAVVFISLAVFLRVNHERNQTWKQCLNRMDVAGNLIFVASVVSMLISLTWAGSVYPWDNYRIIVPLVAGSFGLGIFVLYEWRWCKNPAFPHEIVANRTSVTAFFLTIIHSVTMYWVLLFMPVYFQGVLAQTPFQTG